MGYFKFILSFRFAYTFTRNLTRSSLMNSPSRKKTFFSLLLFDIFFLNFSLTFLQALRLSSTARKQTTIGQVVNLMSVDAQKVQDLYLYGNLLWSLPLTITLCIVFLWQTIGPSCLAGLALLLILLPINTMYLANKTFNQQVRGPCL